MEKSQGMKRPSGGAGQQRQEPHLPAALALALPCILQAAHLHRHRGNQGTANTGEDNKLFFFFLFPEGKIEDEYGNVNNAVFKVVTQQYLFFTLLSKCHCMAIAMLLDKLLLQKIHSFLWLSMEEESHLSPVLSHLGA